MPRSEFALSHFLSKRILSFRYAISGFRYVVTTQQNAWIHALASVLVILLAWWLKLSPHDWAVLILTIGTVWTAEFINTALEAVVDLAIPTHHPLAKVGKDVGAAAVLISAISSIVIGGLIMGPPLWQKINTLIGH
jgi:diacylglycerol kinase (ATP)